MYEAIVTLVLPEQNDEPAHTKVIRMEFDTEEAMEEAIWSASLLAAEFKPLTS